MESGLIAYKVESEDQTNKQRLENKERQNKEPIEHALLRFLFKYNTEPETSLGRITHTCYI